MKRIITALIIGVFWLLLLYAGSFPLFWLVVTIVSGIALYEYFSMVTASLVRNQIRMGVVLGLLPVIASFSNRTDLVAVSLIASMLFLFLLVITRTPVFTNPFEVLAKFSFGILYVGFFGAHIILLMGTHQGPLWLVMLTAITIFSDTGAYYTGSFIGKNKLCPSTSPNKTIEGFLGGLALGVLAAIIVKFLFFPKMAVFIVVLVAILISGIGVLGDLTESTIKRGTSFKDSGGLLPGHGGILDRIDSLLITAPMFFYMVNFNLLNGP